MNIRNKLTLRFTGLVALILLSLSLSIYYLSQRYTREEFNERLAQRAYLAGQLFLEQDEKKPDISNIAKKRFRQTMPEEVIRIYDKAGNEVKEHETGTYEFSESIVQQAMRSGFIELRDKQRHIVGMHYTDNQGDFVILASAVDIYGNSKLDNLRQVLLFGFLTGILVVYFTGRHFALNALKPVSQIVDQVNRIKASNLHMRIEQGDCKDEIETLACTFNEMLARLQASFDSQRTFVRNASHQLRTPLTIMIGEIEVTLSRKREEASYKQTLHMVLDQANQLNKLVNDLLSLATSDGIEQEMEEEVRIDEMLMDIKQEMTRAYPDLELHLNLSALPECQEQVTVRGNRTYLKQALGNIVNNALKYSNGKPASIELKTDTNQVLVKVKDQGIGIKPQDKEHIFQPFYRGTNTQAVQGNGIGLTLAMNLIQMHGGSISVTSAVNKGTTVHVLLPNIQQQGQHEPVALSA